MTQIKVAWVCDHNPFGLGGGAERNDLAMVKYGFWKGFDIDIITPQKYKETKFSKYDILILSNTADFSEKQIAEITKYNHVIFHHDFITLCKWRLYFNPSGNGGKCLERCKWHWRDYWKNRRKNLMSNHNLHVFLSPLHKAIHLNTLSRGIHGFDMKKQFIEDIYSCEFAIIPSAIDVSMFKDLGKEREENSVLICNPYPFKGLDNILAAIDAAKKVGPEITGAFLTSDTKFYWMGNTTQPEKLEGIEKLGWIPYNEMNRIFNRFEAVLHLPNNVDPFCRFVVEAKLAGCKVIGNNNIGAFSYSWIDDDDKIRKHLTNAPKKFWKAIMKVM